MTTASCTCAFLGVAERFGLVQSIDRWVVAQAIRLMDRRLRAGGHTPRGEPLGRSVTTLSYRADPARVARTESTPTT